MISFSDLPLELLAAIIQNVWQPSSLASFCLVNKGFCKFTQPFLYRTIAGMHWWKMVQLFSTLSSSPELAKHVRKLEVRFFPAQPDRLRLCFQGLANTVNLRCFIWTDVKSLRSDTLLAVLNHPSLQELEINAHHNEYYERTTLTQFTSLRRIKLIMPSPPVLEVLPAWLKSLASPLQKLSIAFDCGSALTDLFLKQISEDLSGLDELHLPSCQIVTHEGLVDALRHNRNGIKSLNIENISPSFDLQEFDRRCRKAQLLNCLTSLTLSINDALLRSAWVEDIPNLVASSPLDHFQLYCNAPVRDLMRIQMGDFITALISTHGSRLRRLSIDRLPISLKELDDICTGFPNLEQIFTVVKGETLPENTGNSLSKATKLQAVHINFTRRFIYEQELLCVSDWSALRIASCCSRTLAQLGSALRVWQVTREVTQEGEVQIVLVELPQMDRQTEVPHQFLVWHL